MYIVIKNHNGLELVLWQNCLVNETVWTLFSHELSETKKRKKRRWVETNKGRKKSQHSLIYFFMPVTQRFSDFSDKKNKKCKYWPGLRRRHTHFHFLHLPCFLQVLLMAAEASYPIFCPGAAEVLPLSFWRAQPVWLVCPWWESHRQTFQSQWKQETKIW